MRGHICADLIFSCNKLGGWGVWEGGSKDESKISNHLLRGKNLCVIFLSILIRIWAISQPGEVCILMWFGHIPYPQFFSFCCSQIPQNFLFFREKIGRKSSSSPVFSQGFLQTKETIFETENKPSVEKIISCFSLFSVIWKSLQRNSFKMFQAGMLNTSWGMLQHEDPPCNRKHRASPAPGGAVPHCWAGLREDAVPGSGRAQAQLGKATSPSQGWTGRPDGDCCALIYLPRYNQRSLQSLRATLQVSLRTRHSLPLVFKKDSAQFAWQHARSWPWRY